MTRTKDKANGKGRKAKAESVLWALSFGLALSLVLSPLSFACTIGVFGPSATSSGRPLLWKNRDVNDENQEMRFFRGPRFCYVTNVYAGDTLNAWAGINEAGFAIMNSNSFNILDRDQHLADDGNVMSLALGICATVAEFAQLLDSLNVNGRETPANYGVFDSTGMASMFEASNLLYRRYDCRDDTIGLIIRANYSMSGNPGRETGKERYQRAMQLVLPARRQNRIDARFIVETLARDIGSTSFSPYPLPFRGHYRDLPYGYVSTDSTICRKKTRSVEVMVGTRPGEPAGRAMMWVLLGSPEVSLPVPLWVQAGPVPEPLDGAERARLCDEAIRLRDYVRPDLYRPEAINTFRLADLLDRFAAVEARLFDLVDSAEAVWPEGGPSPEQARTLTSDACQTVLDAYIQFWDHVHREPCSPLPDTFLPTRQNVSRDTVLFGTPASTRAGTAKVFDVSGRQVATFAVLGGPRTAAWCATGLPAGGYFVVFPASATAPPARFTLVR
ncbi:hypothetical protein FJY70_02510 [candidate division WOR-3 bacterium]|nr:hypothetical protein [candidate division WOR-3 bacterium]